jgi:hypothetical protein
VLDECPQIGDLDVFVFRLLEVLRQLLEIQRAEVPGLAGLRDPLF